MALPKINSSPRYDLVIPSTGQRIRYRPYLVKEEKVLMIAFESGDQKQAMQAIADTLEACIEDNIRVRNLTTFDVEYMFSQIRSKSVGEVASIIIKCSECESQNEYSLDVSTIKVDVPELNKEISLTDDIVVALKFPEYQSMINSKFDGTRLSDGFSMIGACIDCILTEDEKFDASDVSQEELDEFLESLTTEQFSKITEFLGKVPTIEHKAEFSCGSCGHDNEVTLRGLKDFL
jgi:DNA-directed RNA polymerase subunit M/transcription elongation factor TFIIS